MFGSDDGNKGDVVNDDDGVEPKEAAAISQPPSIESSLPPTTKPTTIEPKLPPPTEPTAIESLLPLLPLEMSAKLPAETELLCESTDT